MMWSVEPHQGELTVQEYRRQADRERMVRQAQAGAAHTAPTRFQHALAGTLQRWGQQLLLAAQDLDPTLTPSASSGRRSAESPVQGVAS